MGLLAKCDSVICKTSSGNCRSCKRSLKANEEKVNERAFGSVCCGVNVACLTVRLNLTGPFEIMESRRFKVKCVVVCDLVIVL